MLKKSFAVSLTAALLLTGPGRSAAWAIGTVARPVPVARLNAPAMTVFSAPHLAPLSASLLSAPAHLSPALVAPNGAPLAAAPVAPLAAPIAADLAIGRGSAASTLRQEAAAPTALLSVTDAAAALTAPNAAPAAQTGVLNGLYEGIERPTGFEAFDVLGQAAANDAPLAPASAISAADRRTVPVAAVKDASVKNGGLLMEVGIGAAVIGVLLAIKQSRELIVRLGSVIGIRIGGLLRGLRSTQSLRDEIFKELEEGRDQYNNEVLRADASVQTKKLELDGLTKQNASFETQIDQKLAAMKAAGEETPAGKTMKQAARDLVRDQEMLKNSITATTADLGKLQGALDKAKQDRQGFFYVRAERLQALKSGMTAEEIGLADTRLAGMKQRYQLDGEDKLAEVDGRVADTVAKGKADQDVVNTDPREQKRKAGERLEERKVDDALEERLKRLNDGGTKNGGAIEAKHLIHFAEGLAVLGSFFFPMYAAVAVLATALVAMVVPPAAQQWAGRRLALIGLGTLVVGGLPLLLAKSFGFVGIIGFGTTLGFILPGIAAVIVGFGIAYKGYLSNKKTATAAAAPVVEQPVVAQPVAAAPVAAQPVAEPSGPTRLEQGAEIAKRAGDAAGKLAETGVKAAGQAADKALGAADKGVKGLEELADQAAAAVGSSTSKDPVPEVGAIAKRLRDVSLRLAEAGVTKVEQASGMKAGDPVPSAPSLIARLWNALMVIFGNQVAKLETPEVLAKMLLNTLDAAEKAQREAVRAAAYEYRKIEGRLEAARAAAVLAESKVDRLLKPRVDGKPISVEDEAAAKLFIADLRLAELTVAGNIEQLAVAKAQMELTIKRRAEIFADRAEALVAVRSGLSKAQIAELRGRLAQMEQEYVTGVSELTRKFDEKVSDAVAAGQADQDVVDSDPTAVKQRAERRMSAETVDAELERRKKALSEGASAKNGGQVPGYIWLGVAAGTIAQLAAMLHFGFDALMPYVAVAGFGGLAAGAVHQLTSNTRTSVLFSAALGALLSTFTVVASPAVAVLGAVAGAIVAAFFSRSERKSGVMAFGGAAFAGMFMGVTLPAWLGAFGMKTLLDNAAKRNGGSVGVSMLPLASATGLAALGVFVGGAAVGFIVGAIAGYVYLEFLSAKRNNRDLNDLVFGVIAWGAGSALLTAVGSLLFFI